MGSYPDYKFEALGILGYDQGSLDDRYLAFLLEHGGVTPCIPDAEREALVQQGSWDENTSQTNDAKYSLGVSWGYTGSLRDMEYAYWKGIVEGTPGPGVIVKDRFVDTPGTLIQDHTPDTAPGVWLRLPVLSGTLDNNAMYLNGFDLLFRDSPFQGARILSNATDEIRVQCRLKLNSAPAFNFLLVLRFAAADDFVAVRYRTGDGTVEIIQVLNNVETVLGSGSYTFDPTLNYLMEGQIRANNDIEAKVDSVVLATASNVTTLNTVNFQGLAVLDGTEFRPEFASFTVRRT